jgi:NAD-dependent DNA ligase
MIKNLDKDGQPINKRFNALRLQDRAIDQLIGLSGGVIADGVVTQDEAQMLLGWLEMNVIVIDKWPASFIYTRLKEMMSDGVLDENEQKELLKILSDTTGNSSIVERCEAETASLPLNKPAPTIKFENSIFCFTGKFFYGSRAKCEKEVHDRSGTTKSGIARNLDYLVIGSFGSTDWIHSSFGRKIEKAVEYREQGVPLGIVSEEHWIDHVLLGEV